MHPARNGCDYELPPDVPMPGIDRVYRPETDEIDALSMGAIPAALVRMPGRARGNHPLGSLSAVGPLAQQLISTQGPMDAFGPLQALACVEGWVVLMGVGLTSMTLLHLAEKLSGRTLFRRWANDANGEPMEVEIGGCSDGFGRFEPTLAHLARATTVGRSLWRAFPAGETLSAAADAVRADPALTHCGRPGCGRCNDAVAGGPMLT
jgi:aminoglycoside 3-N-acetyltransferase